MATAEVRPALPDELLEDIFLRLDDAADLARASAACTSFRRVVSSRRFLRRFRSLHTPPVLGFLEFIGVAGLHFHHAGPPHRSAPAARALAQAADFSFSFLPKDPLKSWRVCDARDGRVLLGRSTSGCGFGDLVVCDPLYRRYVQIPLLADDPVASALHSGKSEFESGWFEAFLAPAGEDEDEDASSFQVICIVLYEDKVVAFIFSSVTGEWLHAASFSFLAYGCIEDPESLVRHNIRSCFYWRHHTWNNLLVLDTCDMKFSVVDPPPDSLNRQWAVADAGEDRLGFIAIDQCTLDFYCKTLRNIDDLGTDEWRHEKRISLPEINCNWSIIGTAEGCFLLLASPRDFFSFPPEMPKAQYFTLEIKTLLVERQCVACRFVYCACLYVSFPPPLSLPSI